jgi:hypothetical protein
MVDVIIRRRWAGKEEGGYVMDPGWCSPWGDILPYVAHKLLFEKM